ncbi:OmpW family outer membrane protein [Novosphingobium sp. ZN18A2]|uniref:OmpW/AlkL family protein n=1 Tax=Novosphingobium sp. ZN18A2 TaxID=3079861 RepID=UPI0030D03945
MKKLIAAALCAACLTPLPAMAGSPDGKLQVKVMGTAVLPDGKIDKIQEIRPDIATAVSGLTFDTKANDNYVPTVAIEYFATPNVSIETICCLTTHHVNGTGDLAGARLVDHVMILPATLTLKYHLNAGPIKPYVGVGPTVFFVFDERPGSGATAALGATRVKMSNSFGVALQGGVDVPLNQNGLGLSLDAKKYFVKPTASFYDASGSLLLRTKHQLDPWVLSAGIAYRF